MQIMKTIKQIANEIGVSKQAVFYRIRKPPLSNTLHLTSNVNGVLMVDEYAEKLIKQAFFDNEINNIVKDTVKESSKENILFDGYFDGEIIRLLQENILILQEQLKIKDKQIEELTLAVRTQAESINVDMKNKLAEILVNNQKEITKQDKSDNIEDKSTKKAWQFWKKGYNS